MAVCGFVWVFMGVWDSECLSVCMGFHGCLSGSWYLWVSMCVYG